MVKFGLRVPMPRTVRTAPDTGVVDVAGLLRSSGNLESTLHAVAGALSRSLNFRTVAINLYRPAWDDFEVVAVHGGEEARRALLGTASASSEWDHLIDDRFRRGGAYVIEAGAVDWNEGYTITYVPPPGPAAGQPDAWHPHDAIFVPLRGAHGQILGIVSIDEPLDGLRPTDDQLEVLAGVAAQAALVVESGQHADTARRQRVALEQLLRVSASLTGRQSPEEVLQTVAVGLHDALGFDKVVAWRVEDGRMALCAEVGSSPQNGKLDSVPVEYFEPALRPENLIEGCSLLTQEQAHRLVPEQVHGAYRSRTNGAGPNGWNHHWLLVPVRDAADRLTAVLWVDDPADRLIPPPERLQALRLFANQAAAALETARHVEQLRHLAEHDPLTGLLNRRGLNAAFDDALAAGAALVVLDIDSFKRINDSLGYDVGDRILRRVAELIDRERRPQDVAARLGGQEFALVLPHTSEAGALAMAERLRRMVGETVTGVPWGVSLSAGVAGMHAGATDDLLRHATRALYAAKRLGRNRSVVYAPETLEALLGDLERTDGSAAQMAAVIMLAEAMDLRDAGTARHSQTVGRYAEAIAATLSLEPERVERVRVAGVLHDIGKLAVPDSILHKPGKLDDAEWAEIQRHPEMGAQILESAGLRDVAAWVRAHHERIDGRGYPGALPDADIPLEAKVLAVADAYEAMIADRPYRAGMSQAEARAELRRCAGSQFDAAVVDAFLRVLEHEDALSA